MFNTGNPEQDAIAFSNKQLKEDYEYPENFWTREVKPPRTDEEWEKEWAHIKKMQGEI